MSRGGGQGRDFWAGKKVLVTGGAGFLGSHVVDRLAARGCSEIIVPRSAEYDLREEAAVRRLYAEARPDLVFHLAAVVGGIGANRAQPGRFFYDNAIMGLQLMEFARRSGVEKYVAVGTICAYPKHTPVPFHEAELWNGYPEETNAPYGLAKKMSLVQAQAYRRQYGFNAIYLLPVNLYGPRDNFDLHTSHVIPAIMRKCLEAVAQRSDRIALWGTGQATREFLYVEDAAEGIVLAAEKHDSPEPLNLGTGEEIQIAMLAQKIAGLCGFSGGIVWDADKPDGQPRRCVDISRARTVLGFAPHWSLDAGLRATLAWFRENQPALKTKM